MDTPDSFDHEVVILGVDFSEDYEHVKLRYVENRNVTAQAFKDECITLEAKLLEDGDLADMIETLVNMVDAGLLHIRTDGGV